LNQDFFRVGLTPIRLSVFVLNCRLLIILTHFMDDLMPSLFALFKIKISERYFNDSGLICQDLFHF